MKHLRSFFAVLLAAAVCAAVVLFSGCGASVQVQQLTIRRARQHPCHADHPANAENMPAVVICHGFTGSRSGDGHFAPLAADLAGYDGNDPEIAVAIVIEHATWGSNLATTGVDILNAYFTADETGSAVTGENQLLP